MKIYILEKPGKCLEQILDCLAENRAVTDIYTFENDIEFLDQIVEYNPDLCIIRAGWGGLHGLRVAEIVKQISPDSRVIILSETKDYALEAFEVGIDGYLLCPVEKEKLIQNVFWRQGR